MPEIIQYLKIRIDGNREQYGRWILTGSQQFQLMKNVSELLAGRIAILEASYITFFLPPYFKNFGKRLNKAPKIYFLDTALVCALTRQPSGSAALAGTAMVLEEMRWIAEGIEQADSFVFNPHKWMFTNFDASAYFVKDREALVNTFSITPEYLKTREDDQVNNYRDWGIQLGRRFRALKLWFVLRNFGAEEIINQI